MGYLALSWLAGGIQILVTGYYDVSCVFSQFPVVVKEHAAVSSVHFSASAPYDFAVTSGSRVSPSLVLEPDSQPIWYRDSLAVQTVAVNRYLKNGLC